METGAPPSASHFGYTAPSSQVRRSSLTALLDDGCYPPTVTLAGDMDAAGLELIESLTRQISTAAGSSLWHVDLSGVTFIDSAGLRMLILIRRAIPPDRDIVLVDPSPNVRQLLALSK